MIGLSALKTFVAQVHSIVIVLTPIVHKLPFFVKIKKTYLLTQFVDNFMDVSQCNHFQLYGSPGSRLKGTGMRIF